MTALPLTGWLKLHRVMLRHPVWQLSPGQFKVWMTMLGLANYRPGEWWDGKERVEISEGSFITSQPHLAEAAGVSRIVVRHALSNLEVLGSIRAKAQAKRWTLIEIVNWPLYQGEAEDVSQAESPGRAKVEPSASHNGRTEEGKKEPAASGLTLPSYLETHAPEGQEILRQTLQAIASTRRNGKVSQTVLDALASKLSRYPTPAVLSACRIYLAKNYAGQGKREPYFLAIVRGESERMKGNGRETSDPVGGQNGRPSIAKTPGQRAIERSIAETLREQEQCQ